MREAAAESLGCSGASLGCPAHLILFFSRGPGRFITMKGKRLCAPLQAPWVVRLQEKLDASCARKVRAGPVLSWEQEHPGVGLSATKQTFPGVIGLLGRAGTCSIEAWILHLSLHPSSLQLGPVWLLCNPSSTPNKCNPGTVAQPVPPWAEPSRCYSKRHWEQTLPLLPCKLGVCNLCTFTGRACNEFGECFLQALPGPCFTTVAWPGEVTP